MSIISDGGTPNGNHFYDDCRPPVRVYVDGEEIPVINEGVKTQSRIDGPLDINKVSDVYFPIEWQDVNIAEKIDAYAPDDGDRDVWQPVDVKFLHPDTDEYITYHRGFSMAYGAGSKGTLERKLRVGDPGMLLNNTPFTASYGNDATLGDVLRDLIDEFNSHQDVFEVTDVAYIDQLVNDDLERDAFEGDGFLEKVTDIYSPDSIIDRVSNIGNELGITSEKSFKKNRDTLKDVMDFVTKKVDGELYFKPSGDNPRHISLTYDKNRNTEFTPKHLGDDYGPTVIQNNALYEIQPINSVEVHGETDRNVLDGLGDLLPDGSRASANEYPVATARHKRLYELAGAEYKPPIIEDEATAEAEAQEVAREELLDRIEGGGMGEIILYQYALIDTHDMITTKPACGDNVAQDVGPITYSVEEVTQQVGYDDNDNFRRRTHLRVNTHVTNDDIEIVDSGTEEL